jgi:tape measure domain-containing protein
MSIATEIRLRIKTEGESVLQGLGDKLNKIAANATVSSGKFSLLAGELRKVESTTVRSTNALKTYSASWRELAGSVDLASKEFKEATAEAARLDAQIAKAEGRNRKAGSRLKTGAQVAGTAVAAGIFGGPEAAIGAVAGGIAGGVPGAVLGSTIGATVSQLRQALGATAAYEAEIKKLEIALKGVTTNQIEYNDALKFIQTSTDNYAVTQDILTRQFTKLQASVQGSGGSLQDTKIVFDGIVSAVRATGGSLQDVDSALTATAQVFSKGKVSAEELRQQIGERLPGAFTLFAKSMGKTPQELDKALEGGKVSLQDFMVFAKELFDRYGENAKIIADSPAAAGDRLQIALSNLSKSIGVLLQPIGAAFQDTFTSIAEDITRATNALANFFGISGEALLRKNTLLIQAQTKVIKLNKDELARLAERQGPITVTTDRTRDVAAGLDAIRMSTLKTNISNAEKQRDKLRKEINDAQRDPLVLPTADGKGLPGIDPGAGKKAKAPSRSLSDAMRDIGLRQLDNELAKSRYKLSLKILDAEDAGRKDLAQSLKLAQPFVELNLQLNALESERTKILTKRDSWLKQGVDKKKIDEMLGKNLLAQDTLRTDQAKAVNELIRDQNQLRQEGIKINADALRVIEDAEIAAGMRPGVDKDALRIDRAVDELQTRLQEARDKGLSNVNVDDFVKRLRTALETEVANAKDFGKQFGKAFQDGIKSMGDLAGNLGSSFASAFGGMADQLTEFVATGKANFSEFAASVLKDLGSIFIKFAFFQALKALVPSGSAFGKFLGFANGAAFAQNGIQPFARGGIVSQPTLFPFAKGTGLMGEAGPEAIMPLKRGADGKLGVAANLDGAMSRYRRSPGAGGGGAEGGGTVEGGSAAAGGPMAIDVRYSVERINDVEYVTASQFQAGMRQAAQQGAAQGEQRTLRRLQQSPSTRKRVGV